MDLSLLRQKECSGGKGQEMRASMTASRHPLAQAVWSSVCRRDGDIAVTERERERDLHQGRCVEGKWRNSSQSRTPLGQDSCRTDPPATPPPAHNTPSSCLLCC